MENVFPSKKASSLQRKVFQELTYMHSILGSISPTYLRTAFTPVAPKSVRIQSSCQYLFTLLGSTGAKAACRTSMKLTPKVNFTNLLTKTTNVRVVIVLPNSISPTKLYLTLPVHTTRSHD